jgi:RNA polymerase sigma-70 factor (ECF subfamily)
VDEKMVKDFSDYIGEGRATSVGLLERVRAGSDPAWERLVRLYSPLVDFWLKQAGLQHADIDDVRQEVFLGLNRKIKDFRQDGNPKAFRRWLWRVTQHKLSDHWRNCEGLPQTEKNQVLAALASTDDSAADAPEALALLYRRALDLMETDLKPQTWQAFWRVVIESRPVAEVAAELNVTTNAVYIAKARVLAKLREEFAGLIES